MFYFARPRSAVQRDVFPLGLVDLVTVLETRTGAYTVASIESLTLFDVPLSRCIFMEETGSGRYMVSWGLRANEVQ
jgi:hypothetical protein